MMVVCLGVKLGFCGKTVFTSLQNRFQISTLKNDFSLTQAGGTEDTLSAVFSKISMFLFSATSQFNSSLF